MPTATSCNVCGHLLTNETRARLPEYPDAVPHYCQACADAEDAEVREHDTALFMRLAGEPVECPDHPHGGALWRILEDADIDEENLLPGVYR